MPDDKNFLDQFSESGKPASFKEEERTPVVRERKPLNVKALVIAVLILALLGALAYFLFLRPKIEMPDFIGKSRSDVAAWVKQQGIEPSGIIFDDTYDFDSDEGSILSQSVAAGKKVGKDVKLNFTLSLGPDPDERVKVPDLETMDKQEIQEWISSNRLLKTKTITSYSDEVPENNVIDYSFSGCEEDSFTRGCTLKITVSKGPALAGKVTVEDFEKKPFASAEAWAKSKKIELIRVDQYSDKVDAEYVISQSVAAGKTIKEGDSLTVVVSLGQAVYMPDMTGWTRKQVEAWMRKNPSVYLDMSEGLYSSQAKDTVLSQSKSPKALIDPQDVVELTMSLGNIVDLERSYVGEEYHATNGLHDWKEKQNDLGADISVNRTRDFSDVWPPGVIIRHDNSVYVGGTLNCVISRGKNILLRDGDVTWADLAAGNGVTEDEARKLCEEQGVNYAVEYVNKAGSGKQNGDVLYAQRWDKEKIVAGTYLPQDIVLTIYVYDDNAD